MIIMYYLLSAASSSVRFDGVCVGDLRHPVMVRELLLVREPQLGEEEDSSEYRDDNVTTPEISSPPAPGRNPRAPPRRS